jgi:hypothetical protein
MNSYKELLNSYIQSCKKISFISLSFLRKSSAHFNMKDGGITVKLYSIGSFG